MFSVVASGWNYSKTLFEKLPSGTTKGDDDL
jgi:hypothetical protein